MKLTVRDILSSRNTIEQFLAISVDALTAYKMSRNIRHLRYEIQDLEKIQDSLFKKYGDMQPTGQYRIRPEEIEAFTEEHSAFQDGEVEVDIRPMPIKLFEGKQMVQKITADLWFLFDQEEDLDAVAPEAAKS